MELFIFRTLPSRKFRKRILTAKNIEIKKNNQWLNNQKLTKKIYFETIEHFSEIIKKMLNEGDREMY